MVRPLSKRRSFVAMLMASFEDVTKSVTTDMADSRSFQRRFGAVFPLLLPDLNARGVSSVFPGTLPCVLCGVAAAMADRRSAE